MKTKKVVLIIIVALLTGNTIFAQIKVTNSGWVNIGSTVNPIMKLQVSGSAVFTPCTSGCSNSCAYIRGNNGFSGANNPDYTWWNSDQTGIFHRAADQIGFTIGGIEKMSIGTNYVYFTNINQTVQSAPYIRTTNAWSSQTTPDYSWYNDDITGIFHPIGGSIGFTTVGNQRMIINSSGQVAIGGSPVSNYKFTIYGNAYASGGTWTPSDFKYKKNIKPIETALTKVLKLNGIIYEYKTDEYKSLNFNTGCNLGFIAQELQKILPEAVREDSDGFFSINYDQVIPVLVEAFKEQQAQIQKLQQDLEFFYVNINNSGGAIKNNMKQDNDDLNSIQKNNTLTDVILYQNVPNPFSENTSIKLFLPQNITKSKLCIYNVNGGLVKCITLSANGFIAITIKGNELESGIYSYVLIYDGQASETKQMILTK